jgi:glucosyl-dolichyl phosphate glucuronosyltransferase
MAFRRAVFDRVGLFDPALGRKGTASLLSNEETALLRAVGNDHTFYIPDMVVDHLVPHERLRADWFRKRVFWQAVSDVLSGSEWTTQDKALAGLTAVSASAPAEWRGLKLLRYEPRTPQEMRDQLRAVYLQALLLTEGSPRHDGAGLGA